MAEFSRKKRRRGGDTETAVWAVSHSASPQNAIERSVDGVEIRRQPKKRRRANKTREKKRNKVCLVSDKEICLRQFKSNFEMMINASEQSEVDDPIWILLERPTRIFWSNLESAKMGSIKSTNYGQGVIRKHESRLTSKEAARNGNSRK
ncbi:hypothetical protein Ddc_15236 [Ditylenchus destructor]|nr:hypothetical protein Ddc_15236 [Ditylenchus destructor]